MPSDLLPHPARGMTSTSHIEIPGPYARYLPHHGQDFFPLVLTDMLRSMKCRRSAATFSNCNLHPRKDVLEFRRHVSVEWVPDNVLICEKSYATGEMRAKRVYDVRSMKTYHRS